ncbi:MAG: hypothetical protein O3A63_04130 [Proteobacteria bacterium]|nr:hypothetical protein [Pseudomonadota bacterium]
MSKLDGYIQQCKGRLKSRFVARGLFLLVAAVVLFTVLFAVSVVTYVPTATTVLMLRVLLYAALGGVVAWLIWKPFTARSVTTTIEACVAQFNGRLATWRDTTERGHLTPILTLLTDTVARTAEQHPPRRVIPVSHTLTPAVVATLLVTAMITWMSTGNSPWQLAAKRLWTGELFTSAAPYIAVSPGDLVVPRGTDVVIEAQPGGFLASTMTISARFESGLTAETALMVRLADGKFGFVLVGVNEQVSYYVHASGMNSARYQILVADLPRVTEVSVTFDFPEWTGLPQHTEHDGDVTGLPGTAVQIAASVDRPLAEAILVVNGTASDMRSEALALSGEFAIDKPGTWHIAMEHEGVMVRISDEYLIRPVTDQPPEVAFTWPGHDRQATSIEEVTLRFSATDDFGVEQFRLKYSVNASSWNNVEFAPGADAEYVLDLETLSVKEPDQTRALRAGDMLTFYAEVADHTQTTRSALYFVDVRPFDRIYREADQGGNEGGAGGAGFELADRQREIVTATWNLILRQDEEAAGVERNSSNSELALSDQAELLAMLQRTLKDQVATLIERAQARDLTSDDSVDAFVEELNKAVEYMDPAAEMLETGAFNDAVTPEQQALQHLLAAETTMSDVNVSMGNSSGRGTSGRSLSELMDIEMDPERNRYEVPESPDFSDPTQQAEDDWQKIQELAARQERMAENSSKTEQSLASRWQQERLKRELEEMRERLEQRAANGQNTQNLQTAIDNLQRAEQALDEAMRSEQNIDQRSATEAAQALQRAATELQQTARDRLQQELARSRRDIENLVRDQQATIERLEQLERESLEANRRGENSSMQNFEMAPFADRKRRMQSDLNDVRGDLADIGEAIGERDPDAQKVIERALDDLSKQRIDERLAASADAFEMGRPLFAIGNEDTVARALERLADRLEQAEQLLGGPGSAGAQSPLETVRTLRSALREAQQPDPSGAGGYGADIRSIARAADGLTTELENQIGERVEFDTAMSRAGYQPLGTDEANTAAMVQMLADRLDVLEAMLLSLDSSPIRAELPRDEQRDSSSASHYYRLLSEGVERD